MDWKSRGGTTRPRGTGRTALRCTSLPMKGRLVRNDWRMANETADGAPRDPRDSARGGRLVIAATGSSQHPARTSPLWACPTRRRSADLLITLCGRIVKCNVLASAGQRPHAAGPGGTPRPGQPGCPGTTACPHRLDADALRCGRATPRGSPGPARGIASGSSRPPAASTAGHEAPGMNNRHSQAGTFQ